MRALHERFAVQTRGQSHYTGHTPRLSDPTRLAAALKSEAALVTALLLSGDGGL